jgi:hypothetical protein
MVAGGVGGANVKLRWREMIKIATIRVEGEGPFSFPVLETDYDLSRLTGRFELRQFLNGPVILASEPEVTSIAARLKKLGPEPPLTQRAKLAPFVSQKLLVTVDQLRAFGSDGAS